MLKENIKYFREQCGFTLDEVSQKLGVSKPTLQRYESGVISNIPSDKVEKLAKIFEITPSRLMGWDEFDDKYNLDCKLANVVDKYSIFISFIESIGYIIQSELNEVIESHEEDLILNGEVIGKDKVIDNATYNRVLTKEGKSTIFTEAEFNEFKNTIERSVEFEIFKAAHKK